MKLLRLRYKQLGGHTHVRVFIGMPGQTFAKAGDLTFSNDEWEDIQRLLRNAEILPEETQIQRLSRRHDEND